MDAWTSPNHRAFVTWTVHLEYEGQMLSFLLDVVELPEVCEINNTKYITTNTYFQSHTGVAMAKAFQAMLERFGLTKKILAVNADNATSNDKQTTKLDQLDNTFNKENRVRCFNHTLQLSAKALLKPFNTGLSGKATDDDETQDPDDNPEMFEEDEDEGDEEEQPDEEDVEDDNIDELEELSQSEQNRVLQETADVRETVSKVRMLP